MPRRSTFLRGSLLPNDCLSFICVFVRGKSLMYAQELGCVPIAIPTEA